MNVTTKSLLIAGAVAGLVLTNTSATSATNNNDCIDGSVRSSLQVTFDGPSTAVINTKSNKALCENVELYLSSYTMPDNYNGERFSNNPTATPQELFASTTFTLNKGFTGPKTITVEVPKECKNVQSDVYYPPEVKTVGPSGHPADQIVKGQIFPKTQDECEPVVVVEPPVEEEPVVETPDVLGGGEGTSEPKGTPTELPKTGTSVNILLALLSSAGTYAAVLRLRK